MIDPSVIGLGLTLLAAMGGGIWRASQLTARLSALEKNSGDTQAVQNRATENRERIVALEVHRGETARRLDEIGENINRIINLLTDN